MLIIRKHESFFESKKMGLAKKRPLKLRKKNNYNEIKLMKKKNIKKYISKFINEWIKKYGLKHRNIMIYRMTECYVRILSEEPKKSQEEPSKKELINFLLKSENLIRNYSEPDQPEPEQKVQEKSI